MTDTRDWDLLIRLLCGTPAPEALGEDDWARAARLAQQLGVITLLHDRTTSLGEAVPPATREQLRTAWRHAAMRNTRIYHYLDRILAAFAEAGIPVVLLKGAYLAKAVYRTIALRPMGDLDLMVPVAHLEGAADIAQRLGYAPAEPLIAAEMRTRHHLPTFINDDGVSLEVHGSEDFMRLPRPLSADALDAFWTRTIPVRLDGRSVRAPSPEDHLFYLCAHATYGHRCVVDLRPCFDIAELLRRHAIDWTRVLNLARQTGALPGVLLMLELARRWAGAVVPADLPTDARLDEALIAHVRGKFLLAPRHDFTVRWCAGETCLLSLDFTAFFGRRGITLKTRPLVEGLFPPLAAMAAHHPACEGRLWRALPYYPWRWLAFLGRTGRVAWAAARGQLTVASPLRQEIRLRKILYHARQPIAP